jgi:RNA polymerase sigma-70 factor (sigma-E family)
MAAQSRRAPTRLYYEMAESVAMDSDPELHTAAETVHDRLDDVYRRNAPAATRLAYVLTGDRDLTQDLVQEAFVRLAGRFVHLRVPDAVDAYLRRTIVNLFTSQLRRRRVERAWLARHAAEPTSAATDDPALRDEQWQALGRLPNRQRAALVLRFYEDLSEADAAAILGCSTSAVNSLVVRGLRALRSELGSDHVGDGGDEA